MNTGTQKNKDSLQKVQRRAARFFSNDFSPSSSVTSMLNDLKWDNIETRRQTQRLVTLHMILHEEMDIPYHNYIQTKPQRSRRTHNKLFNLTNCTSTPFAQPFFRDTIKRWNSIPYQLLLMWHKRQIQRNRFKTLTHHITDSRHDSSNFRL